MNFKFGYRVVKFSTLFGILRSEERAVNWENSLMPDLE